jgi:hypothetical protein
MLLCSTYVRNKLDNLCTRRFCHKYYGVQISASSNIFEKVNKPCSAVSSLDKIHNRKKAGLTEENPDKAGARLEHSPHKSLTRLKRCVYHHIKLDRLKQLKSIITGEEHTFVTGFCEQYMAVFLTQNLHSLPVKLGSI